MEKEKNYKESKKLIWSKKVLFFSILLAFVFNFVFLSLSFFLISKKSDRAFITVSIILSFLLLISFYLKASSNTNYISLFFNIRYIYNKKISKRIYSYLISILYLIAVYTIAIIIFKITRENDFSYKFKKYIYLLAFIISAYGSLMILVYFEIYRYEIVKRKYIQDGVTVFSNKEHFQNNSYLVCKNKKAILIDGGNNTPLIKEYLQKNNIELTHILITHFHFDHWIGLNQINNINEKIIFLVNNVTHDWMYSKSENNKKYLEDLSKKIDLKLLPDFKINKFNAGDNLNINNIEIKTLLVPGHTPDSVFYLIESMNAIFVGDTIFYNDVGFHNFEYTNIEEFKKSILYIQNYNKNVIVYPGHHKIFTVNKSKKWNLIEKIKI